MKDDIKDDDSPGACTAEKEAGWRGARLGAGRPGIPGILGGLGTLGTGRVTRFSSRIRP